MIDISQILNGGAAAATATRAPAATPSNDAAQFGDALNRARQNGSAPARQPDAGRADGDGPSRAAQPADQSAQPNAQPRTADADTPRNGGTDVSDRDDGDDDKPTDSAAAAAAALLAGIPPATVPAQGAAAASGDAAAASRGTALPVTTGLPGAAAPTAGDTAAAAATEPSLAAQTLDTIASQRAALAATAAPAGAGDHPAAALPERTPAGTGKPVVNADTLVKTAVDPNAMASSSNGKPGDGADLGRPGTHTLLHADSNAATPAAPANPAATNPMQAALAAATSQRQAEPAASTDASSPLPQLVATAVAVAARSDGGTTATALPVAPRVGDADWPQALSQQVIRLSTQGSHTAELQLNPPELGPLKVVLNISNDQAQAQFMSPHAGVRAAVEAALPQLRHALADSGIQLGQTSVGAEQFAGQSGNGQQQASQQGTQRFAQGGPEYPRQAVPADTAATPAPRRVALGEVDTFA